MKKLYGIGQGVMILGSVLYLLDILNIPGKIPALAGLTYSKAYPGTVDWIIGGIYAVSLVLMLIGYLSGGKPKTKKA